MFSPFLSIPFLHGNTFYFQTLSFFFSFFLFLTSFPSPISSPFPLPKHPLERRGAQPLPLSPCWQDAGEVPRRCQRFLLPPCQHNGDIQAGTAEPSTDPEPPPFSPSLSPPVAVAQTAAGDSEQLTPCPSAPAEASRNPASQNKRCARSPPDAAACALGPLLPSPPKSPNLPGNTKPGSFSHPPSRPLRPMCAAEMRGAGAAGAARSPPLRRVSLAFPLLPPVPLVFQRGAGGEAWVGARRRLPSFPSKAERPEKHRRRFQRCSREPCS